MVIKAASRRIRDEDMYEMNPGRCSPCAKRFSSRGIPGVMRFSWCVIPFLQQHLKALNADRQVLEVSGRYGKSENWTTLLRRAVTGPIGSALLGVRPSCECVLPQEAGEGALYPAFLLIQLNNGSVRQPSTWWKTLGMYTRNLERNALPETPLSPRLPARLEARSVFVWHKIANA